MAPLLGGVGVGGCVCRDFFCVPVGDGGWDDGDVRFFLGGGDGGKVSEFIP